MPTTTTTPLLLRVKLSNPSPSWWSVWASGNQPLLWLLGQTTQLHRIFILVLFPLDANYGVVGSVRGLHPGEGRTGDDELNALSRHLMACVSRDDIGGEGEAEKAEV